MAKFKVSDIEWETDGEDVPLPTSEIVDGVDDEDEAIDAMSDKYGWLISSCSVTEIQ